MLVIYSCFSHSNTLASCLIFHLSFMLCDIGGVKISDLKPFPGWVDDVLLWVRPYTAWFHVSCQLKTVSLGRLQDEQR